MRSKEEKRILTGKNKRYWRWIL